MFGTLCQDKCLIGVTLCFTFNLAVAQVNDRDLTDPRAQNVTMHNITAPFQDALPIHNGSGEFKLDIDISDKEEREFPFQAFFSRFHHILSNIEHTTNSISNAHTTMAKIERLTEHDVQSTTNYIGNNLRDLANNVELNARIPDEMKILIQDIVSDVLQRLQRLKKGKGPSIENLVSNVRENLRDLAQKLEPFYGRFVPHTDTELKMIDRGTKSSHAKSPFPNGGKHSSGHIIYDTDDDVIMMDNEHIDRYRLRDLVHSEKRSAEDDSELLLLIQKFQRSQYTNDRIWGDVALIRMLQNPTSGKLAREQWVKDQVTVSQAHNFLRKYSKKGVSFFENELGSLWLSYVGYCWEHGHSEFSPIDFSNNSNWRK
ncbi:uncharacterized protein PHALS_03219 [Plasmopara halstedii]|uniref:RxLR-like protein n=1 Tax=Plasmopara halstedii TaxID=4781 RepID=A0A0P1AW82_PLAHL|nr:uncharacterized protein PHALS_03219 [Plasmopara halstedii]CEG46621.1 hypothetical protein PHALS_03219 [Plasmopara halstedii]|eukprot:XP_024582990.1 hypothetical protein PHALS_03219 [Plasmopara halstedii]